MLSVTYDAAADAAYVYFAPEGFRVARTIEVRDGVNVDYSGDGHVLGVEVLSASRSMPPEVLRSAVQL